ncbi:(d)CMP kinase [Pseudonocardia pini]|uniref:(d)CMP kinase n=1 Tax=Pseudonocardia pini TaxID=2758030 RepID=UPI0015F066DE|nr:(d)CMP kinase [Pseudonocardia pini]
MDIVRARPAGPGGCRLVTVDGWSGSGKSTVAERLGAELGAPVLSMEELYAGWTGLAAAVPLAVEWIAGPLHRGAPARWWPWDWARSVRAATPRTQPVVPVVVLEGCGAGAEPLRPFTSTAIWVECPEPERERRLRRRPDWPGYAPHRAGWRAQEQLLYAAHPTPDVVVGGPGPEERSPTRP